MPTEQQLLQAEHDGLLSPQEQESINQLRDAKGFPPPLGLPQKGTPSPPPEPLTSGSPTNLPMGEGAPVLSDVAKGTVRRLSQSAMDWNSAAHQWGLGWNPEVFRGHLKALGVPDTEQLPVNDPKHWYEAGLAAMGPFYATSPFPYVGGAVEGLTHSRQMGDLAELVTGGPQAFREGVGLVRGVTRIGQNIAGAVKGALTEWQVARMLQEAAAARGDAFNAEMASSIAATGRREAIWKHLSLRPTSLKTPEEEFMSVTDLQTPTSSGPGFRSSGPDPATELEVGRMAGAKGRQRYMLTDEEVGPRAMTEQTGTATKHLFDKSRTIAEKGQLDYNRSSGSVADIEDRADRLITRIQGGKLTEGGIVEPTEKPRGKPLSREEEDLLLKLRYVGGTIDPITGMTTPHPSSPKSMAELQDLYGAVRRAALNPSKYPSLSEAKDEFYGLTEDLGRMIRTELAPHEEAAKAWDRATGYVLNVREPTRETAAVLRGAKTETARYRALVGDRTHLFNSLRTAGPEYARKIRQATFGTMLREAGGNAGKMLEGWSSLEPETKMMLAAPSTPRSARALAEILAQGKPEAQAEMDWTKEFRTHRADLQVGVDAVERAMSRMSTNVHRIKGSMFAGGQLVRGAALALLGSPFALYHLGSYALMTRPGLVSTIFSVPPESARWGQAVAALDAALKPFAQKQGAQQAPVQLPPQ